MKFLYNIDGNILSVFHDKKKGFCVVAYRDICQNELICINPVGLIGFKDLTEKSEFNHYPMWWNDKTDCIAFGAINLLNHSKESNVYLKRDYKKRLISMYALKFIKHGTELVIDYNCELWFDPS